MTPPGQPFLDPALLQPLDAAARRALMRGGSKTFFAASLLLPSRVRDPATALYAYCRLADDAVDMGEDPHAAGRALAGRLAAGRGVSWFHARKFCRQRRQCGADARALVVSGHDD